MLKKRILCLSVQYFCFFLCRVKKTNTTQPSDASTGKRTKASQKPYTVLGQRYEPLPSHERFVQTGIASWYGKGFHGRNTSSGEKYDMYAMTAAHKHFHLVYMLRFITQKWTDVVVRVNDRGPFVKEELLTCHLQPPRSLVFDVSGTAFVRVEALGYRQNDTGGKNKREYTEPPSYDIGNYTVQVGAFRDIRNANVYI